MARIVVGSGVELGCRIVSDGNGRYFVITWSRGHVITREPALNAGLIDEGFCNRSVVFFRYRVFS